MVREKRNDNDGNIKENREDRIKGEAKPQYRQQQQQRHDEKDAAENDVEKKRKTAENQKRNEKRKGIIRRTRARTKPGDQEQEIKKSQRENNS